jgi:hypothetical protein
MIDAIIVLFISMVIGFCWRGDKIFGWKTGEKDKNMD